MTLPMTLDPHDSTFDPHDSTPMTLDPHDSIVFVIAGTGANIRNLKARAESLAAKNIMFLPLQPKARLPEMLAAADVCMVIQKRKVSDIVFPSKMVNIMAAGRPSVVTADSDTELAQVVQESRCGFIACPENVEDLRTTILKAYGDKNLSDKGDRALTYADSHFGREKVLSDLDQLLSSI